VARHRRPREAAPSITISQLIKLPKRTLTALHECAGFPTAPKIATRRIANVGRAGVDLGDLLDSAGVCSEAKLLWSFGLDKGTYADVQSKVYVKDMPLSRLHEGDVLLAYEMNGEPLNSEHGFPLRLIIPGYYGTNAVKWLYRLELADKRPDGPFTTKYYVDPLPPSDENPIGSSKPVWEIAPESIIVSPGDGDILSHGTIEIWGWAWAEAGVDRVEISTDDGRTCIPSALGDGDQWSWRRFSMEWRPVSEGRHTLMSRTVDRRGETQPLSESRNSVHGLSVTVGSIST
jgi:sulfane dehydrogenase subunit SoxC